MKFDILFPNQPETLGAPDMKFEGTSIWKYGELKPCWHCGELTNWIDINFEAYLCSEECSRAKWNEYFEAVKAAGATEPMARKKCKECHTCFNLVWVENVRYYHCWLCQTWWMGRDDNLIQTSDPYLNRLDSPVLEEQPINGETEPQLRGDNNSIGENTKENTEPANQT